MTDYHCLRRADVVSSASRQTDQQASRWWQKEAWRTYERCVSNTFSTAGNITRQLWSSMVHHHILWLPSLSIQAATNHYFHWVEYFCWWRGGGIRPWTFFYFLPNERRLIRLKTYQMWFFCLANGVFIMWTVPHSENFLLFLANFCPLQSPCHRTTYKA